MNLKKLFLYFNTIRHLTLKQLWYNFIRRIYKKNNIVDIDDVGCNSLQLLQPIRYENKIDHESVCFLNERRSFDCVSDWVCIDEPKLWRYNLHYFDYLLDDGASESQKDKLINDWIAISHDLTVDAWEPYPVSLRIVNWVKYFIVYKNNNIPAHWLQSLYQQAAILYGSIEYHILANHYLKNGKGLLFAGAYLNMPLSRQWFEKGKKILLEEASEQIFDDGGHYEKSPMYHSIIVEDYLDTINLLQSNSTAFVPVQLSFLQEKTIKLLDFLDNILMPDGDIPLFNDSAFNVSPHSGLIYDYANRLFGYERKDASSAQSIQAMKNSGYYVIKDADSMCIVDCGSVSPAYQPGHTHCDLLSYELAIAGHRVIINSGLHDYENSEDRQYCRSTKAHNTVEIDGMEQSEIWGQFRVARRAKVFSASLALQDNGTCAFKGSYSPYWSSKMNIVHTREIKYINKQWEISDEISGMGNHVINNYIHIHPDFDCVKENSEYYLLKDSIKIAKIAFSDTVNISFENGWYYPEFGIKTKNTVLRLSNNGLLPINQKYIIKAL